MVGEQTCGMCGRSFTEDQGQPACRSCPLSGGCRMLRCPHCGYENPVTPPWLARVRAWFATPAARSAGYNANGDYTGPVPDTGEAACR